MRPGPDRAATNTVSKLSPKDGTSPAATFMLPSLPACLMPKRSAKNHPATPPRKSFGWHSEKGLFPSAAN